MLFLTFFSTITLGTLRRVLRAYVMYYPQVGYCQGMNFLVRFLYDFVSEESEIFYMLIKLCHSHPHQEHLYHANFTCFNQFSQRVQPIEIERSLNT